jgi:Protein of unknown function (DUF3606)
MPNWEKACRVTPEKLKQIVQRVGVMADDVRREAKSERQ